MSSFNQTLNNNKQFIIAIKIVKSSKIENYLYDKKMKKNVFKAPPKRALVDTEASSTCISQECADELHLIAFGKTEITTASNFCIVGNLYLFPLEKIEVPEVQDALPIFE